jgi:hypothetical protein
MALSRRLLAGLLGLLRRRPHLLQQKARHPLLAFSEAFER